MYGSLSPVSVKILQASLLFSLICNVVFFISYFCVDSSYLSQSAESQSSGTAVSSRQILFVGGVPRSGTTLARAMLDAHPDVRCGEETRIVPRMLDLRKTWSSPLFVGRLDAAEISEEVVDKATNDYILKIILGHGKPAKFMCNKDPLVLNHMVSVVRIFPESKLVLMVRDGRAVAYSIVSRKISIAGVDDTDYIATARYWNEVTRKMVDDCSNLGVKHCLLVFYEKLVQDPKTWMEKILAFGGIPWHESVLHHNELIDKEVFLSK